MIGIFVKLALSQVFRTSEIFILRSIHCVTRFCFFLLVYVQRFVTSFEFPARFEFSKTFSKCSKAERGYRRDHTDHRSNVESPELEEVEVFSFAPLSIYL